METLLSCCLHDPALETSFHIPRFTHRLSLIKAWEIPPGQRILDIGCGQGESSLALAEALGPDCHITGIDDAHPDYGSPFTVQESHQYIAKTALGPRITFIQSDGPSLLKQLPVHAPPSSEYDAAVICHSLWYFPSSQSITALFRALATAQIPRVYVAEYTFEPSLASQLPHILAARAKALLASSRAPRDAYNELQAPNVRARTMDQAAILEVVRDEGFRVRRKGCVTPEVGFLEGYFEARNVAGEKFWKTVVDERLGGEREGEILGLAERVRGEMDGLGREGGETVRAMDSWWAVLELGSAT
ncbi:S-adenosyl-L-methionine-dependent methyltransferase [Usnea florida]